jgi:hypothetical protein
MSVGIPGVSRVRSIKWTWGADDGFWRTCEEKVVFLLEEVGEEDAEADYRWSRQVIGDWRDTQAAMQFTSEKESRMRCE